MNLSGIIQYRVKPLQWQECKSFCTAETPLGNIVVFKKPLGGKRTIWMPNMPPKRTTQTVRDAKKMAEEWYLSRLLPALEEVDG